jgi:hypothetical protein
MCKVNVLIDDDLPLFVSRRVDQAIENDQSSLVVIGRLLRGAFEVGEALASLFAIAVFNDGGVDAGVGEGCLRSKVLDCVAETVRFESDC